MDDIDDIDARIVRLASNGMDWRDIAVIVARPPAKVRERMVSLGLAVDD